MVVPRLELLIVAVSLFCCQRLEDSDAIRDQNRVYVAAVANRTITFGSEVDVDLPVLVRPLTRIQDLAPAVPGKVDYEFRNLSDKPVAIRAAHRLSPGRVHPTFTKLACFCFERQILEPFASRVMPVVYQFSELPADVAQVQLSYFVYRHEIPAEILRPVASQATRP
jgi:cytochrome c oxidase assembly protein subunit 11